MRVFVLGSDNEPTMEKAIGMRVYFKVKVANKDQNHKLTYVRILQVVAAAESYLRSNKDRRVDSWCSSLQTPPPSLECGPNYKRQISQEALCSSTRDNR